MISFFRQASHSRNILLILTVYLVLNWLVYLPFIFGFGEFGRIDFRNESTSVFARYWDGPFYGGLAKTMYDPDDKFYSIFDFSQPEYYLNHMPVYPVLVRLASGVMPIEMALLFVSQVFGVLSVLLLYYFFNLVVGSNQAVVLSLIQLVLPTRSLVLRNVGNSETVFFFFVVLAMIGIYKRKYLLTIFAVSLSVVTRSIGVLFIPGLVIWWWVNYRWDLKKLSMLSLPMVTYAANSVWLHSLNPTAEFGNLTNGFHRLLGGPPFNVFFLKNFDADTEVYLYGMVIIGLFTLYQRARTNSQFKGIFWMSIFYLVVLLFSSHHDNTRLIWPLFPFVVLLPLSRVFIDSRIKIAILILVPAIVFSAWGVLIENAMPLYLYADWMNATE